MTTFRDDRSEYDRLATMEFNLNKCMLALERNQLYPMVQSVIKAALKERLTKGLPAMEQSLFASIDVLKRSFILVGQTDDPVAKEYQKIIKIVQERMRLTERLIV
jgi:hypothetical protein